jgi:hypothetical protein
MPLQLKAAAAEDAEEVSQPATVDPLVQTLVPLKVAAEDAESTKITEI